MEIILLLLALSLAGCNAQKIYFSEKYISIHSERKNLDMISTPLLVQNIILAIKNNAKDEIVKVKANACINKLNRSSIDLSNESDSLQLKRNKRGISLIGELLSSVSDIPSPSAWKDSLKTTKDLVNLAKNEGVVLKHVKGKIDIEEKEIDSIKQELNHIKSKDRAESNALKKSLETLDQSVITDALCYNGETIINQVERENRIIDNIISNSHKKLPSKYMFPKEKISKIINKVTIEEKIHRPIFYSQDEINEIFALESTITAFLPENNSIVSLMHLPLFDYSNEMQTFAIPTLQSSDMDRFHRFTLHANKEIDTFLCSENKNSVRFYASKDLKKCQKHINNNFFVCNERIITLKMKYAQKCKNIQELPKALAIEISQHLVLIDSPQDNIVISCPSSNNSFNITEIKMQEHPIKISLPNECSVESNNFKINKIPSTDKEKITAYEPKAFNIMHLKSKPNKLHFEHKINISNDINDTKNISNTNEEDEELLEEIEAEGNLLTVETANIGNNSLSFTAVLITACVLSFIAFIAFILTSLLTKKQIHSSDSEIRKLKGEIDGCVKETNALRSELKTAQETIKSLKQEFDNSLFSTSLKRNTNDSNQT